MILTPARYLSTLTMGTVIFVYSASMKKVCVQLDLDGTIMPKSLTLLLTPKSPHQTIELPGISKKRDVEIVSIRYF